MFRATAACLGLLVLSACVTPTVTQRAPYTTDFKAFKTVAYSVHSTDETEYGSDLQYGKDCVSLLGTLLGTKLGDMGYKVVAPGEAADFSIDVNVTEAKEGSAAARFFVGFGAGRAALLFDATFKDPQGQVFASLSGGRSYTGMEMNQGPFASKDEIKVRATTRSVQQIQDFIEGVGTPAIAAKAKT